MRPLVATFALVLVAAACSLPGLPSMNVPASPIVGPASGCAASLETDADARSTPDEGPQREDGDAPADPGSTADDVDGDDGDMLALLRAGETPETLHAAIVVWDARVDGAVGDHASSDLIRPPIRA